MDRKRLNRFRRKLERKQVELTASLVKTESERRGLGAKSRGDEGEVAARSYHRDLLHTRGDSSRFQLRQVSRALARIHNREFGICEECGRSINLRRLDAVPWTPHCRDCQEEIESRTGLPGVR